MVAKGDSTVCPFSRQLRIPAIDGFFFASRPVVEVYG